MAVKTKWIVGTIVTLVCLALTLDGLGVFSFSGNASCMLPEGSAFFSATPGVYTEVNTGETVTLVRGISMGTTDVLLTGKNKQDLKIPKCQSRDRGLTNVVNMHLKDSAGNRVDIIIGVVVLPPGGGSEETPLP